MHALLLLFSLLIQTAPAPTTDQVARAYSLFLQARSLDEADDLDGAVVRYKDALAILPDAAPIHAELAGLYARQGAMKEGTASAERALQLDPRSRAAHRILGLIQAAESEDAKPEAAAAMRPMAIVHLERALADNFQDLAAQITLGELYLGNGQHEKAIATLEDFLANRPGYPQAVMLLAEAYRASGKADQAATLAATLGPAGAPSLGRLVDLQQLESRGAWRDAAAGWAALASESGDPVEYRLRQATALANAGAVDEARQVLTDVTGKAPNNTSAWHLMARVEQKAGKTDAAEAAAARIAKIDPADSQGPLAQADIRASRGDYRGVISALESRVLTPAPADIASGAYAEMVGRLGDAWIELKDPNRAVQALESAHQRVPDDDRVLFGLAITAEQTGKFDKAEQAFREVIRRNPTHAPALNYLGYMLADRNKKVSEAVGFIQRALAEDAGNPSYLDSLGWAYYRLARYQLAVEPLERAAKEVPESSVIQDHLGDLYLKLDRFADAVKAFDRSLAGDGEGITPEAIQKKRDRARAKVSAR